MIDGDVHTFDVTENTSPLLLQSGSELFYFGGGRMKQTVEVLAESGIVGSEGGQHSGVIERRVQRLFEIADPGNDLRIQKGVQVLEGERFLLQGIESPQQLDMFFGKEGTSVSARISIRAISKGESGSEPSSPYPRRSHCPATRGWR